MNKGLTILLIILLTTGFACQPKENSQPTDCFGINTDADSNCGIIEVPVNYSMAESENTPLAYIILKGNSKVSDKPPLVFLQGGPGGSAISLYNIWKDSPLRNDRDIILVDQRGTGFSRPYCEWVGDKFFEILVQDLDTNEERESILKVMDKCSEELESRGGNKMMYSTINSVKDLELLRKHLGYREWNLYGASYGSKLALIYMREFPESISAAILQGIFPPEINMYENLISNFGNSLNKLFTACETDSSCSSRYPDFRNDYFKVLQSLRENPLVLENDFVLNAQDLIIITHLMLYQRATAGRIPAMVDELLQLPNPSIGYEISLLRSVLSSLNGPVYWSITAYEELPFNGSEDLLNDLRKNESLFPGHAVVSSDPEVLSTWHSFRAEEIENEPVHSTIPVLVLNGEFDPITPTSNARRMMENLPNARLFELNGEGHSVFNSCFFQLASDFLNQPKTEIMNDCYKQINPVNWK